MQRPQWNMNIHDVTETHDPTPTPDEGFFHESIEQDNNALLSHVIQHNHLPPLANI